VKGGLGKGRSLIGKGEVSHREKGGLSSTIKEWEKGGLSSTIKEWDSVSHPL
jgi:hypothetical protein